MSEILTQDERIRRVKAVLMTYVDPKAKYHGMSAHVLAEKVLAVLDPAPEPKRNLIDRPADGNGDLACTDCGRVYDSVSDPDLALSRHCDSDMCENQGAEEETAGESSRFEDSATYRQGLIDAGRGHLVR